MVGSLFIQNTNIWNTNSDNYRTIAGHLAFFSFISEMKNPKEYTKALYVLQAADTLMYLIAAVVIYRYTGSEVCYSSTSLVQSYALRTTELHLDRRSILIIVKVTSPALGATGPTLQKIGKTPKVSNTFRILSLF